MSDSDAVRGDYFIDQILPVARLSQESDGQLVFEEFLGSCFRVGKSDYALTAAHILPQKDADDLAVITVAEEWEQGKPAKWFAHGIRAWESHPVEDVAVMVLHRVPWKAFLQLTSKPIYSSAPYIQFAYPADAAHEVIIKGMAQFKPDLVYVEGYVRRRINGISVPGIRGEKLFEVSTAAGLGASGSPLILRSLDGIRDVIGVYIGQRVTEGLDPVRLGYAARVDAFCDWAPKLLGGHTILEESQI